jgi:hypothetical protein
MILTIPLGATDLPGVAVPEKKLISFGWDSPMTTEYVKHLEKLEATPFDGYGIRIPEEVGGGYVFRNDLWAKVDKDKQAKFLTAMGRFPVSRTLTHNFLVLYGESAMRWTSDADWKIVLEHVRFCARAAKAGRLGILWDPEPYEARNPWYFDDQPDRKTIPFETYARTVKTRGQEFIQAIQDEYPGVTILSLRQLSDFQTGSPFSARLFGEVDRAKRAEILRDSFFSLHIPFTDGMLAGMADDVSLHDGNEDAYYYTTALDFYRLPTQLRTEGRVLMSEGVRKKFDANFKVGHAVSVDYTAGRWKKLGPFPPELTGQAAELTSAERAQWFEHNVYHALASSDRYVWIYAEDMSWWREEKVPPGYREAIVSAQEKRRGGKPLGFEVEEMLRKARLAAAAKSKPEKR